MILRGFVSPASLSGFTLHSTMCRGFPIPADQRIGTIDVARGLALFGVLMINLVTGFRVSIFQQFLGSAEGSAADNGVEAFLALFVDLKAFATFSFLFGIGLAVQYEHIARRAFPLPLLARRLLILLVFGLIHLLLIWNGDVLTEYAIAGLIVLPLLLLPQRALACTLVLCLVARIWVSLVVRLPSPAELAVHVRDADNIYACGNYLQYVRFSVSELPLLLPLHLWILPRTVALFVVGIWTWRQGILQNPQTHRRLLLGAVLVGVLLGLLLQGTSPASMLPRGIFRAAAGPVLESLAQMSLAVGYVAAAVCIFEFTGFRWLVDWAGPLGRMAFSNYIAESICFGTLFFGYGVGLFGRLTITQAALLGIGVYVIQVLYSIWWLKRFRFGPLEWLWRSLMYGQRQPMRIRDSNTAY